MAHDYTWSERYFPPLVFLEVLHVQMLAVWTLIFDLGHYEELQSLDSTKFTELCSNTNMPLDFS